MYICALLKNFDKIKNIHIYSNGLVVKALDSQSRGPVFKPSG